MKFIFAPDSFKGSLTAAEIAEILTGAAKKHFEGCECVCMPVADGGEGTVDALVMAMGGKEVMCKVTGPMGEEECAKYALVNDGKVAVMEMAQASGLPMVPRDERNPMKATSCGTGEMIAHAVDRGAQEILIGIGGSATNDGGMGMLSALGARFYGKNDEELNGCGEDLAKITRCDFSGLHSELKDIRITVISDVTNPLLGENGATAIYGPQKGADKDMLTALETGMTNYARRVQEATGKDIASFAGAGAAGGMGAALKGVLGAKVKSGIDAVLDQVGFDAALEGCALVVTGEGQIDRQTADFGKVPAGILRRAAKAGVPVVILTGNIKPGAEKVYDLGQAAIMPVATGPMTLEYAMENAHTIMENAADRLMRTLKIGMTMKK